MRDNIKGKALTETTFYVLLSVFTPRHGYAMMQFIEQETAGRLSLGAGTLYGASNALLKKGWMEPYGAEDGRKKEYVITEAGRKAAEGERERLKRLLCTADTIIGGVEHE